MDRARRHQRLLSRLAFLLLALCAELAGRSLTHRLDFGRHVGRLSYSGANYYPFLLAAVKVLVALMLARLAWRFAKARATERAARRLGAAVGARTPRVRIELSPRLWLVSFLVTASIYLVQTDAEQAASGRWPLLAPWLHSSALPVFAVLAVVVAVLFRAAEQYLGDYERFAAAALASVQRAASDPPAPRRHSIELVAPRSRFGVSFESRPPPAFA